VDDRARPRACSSAIGGLRRRRRLGAPRLSPAVVWVGDQDRGFGVEGLSPVAYLRADDGEVRLIDDFAATIGDVRDPRWSASTVSGST
jgi:hypothetical protein